MRLFIINLTGAVRNLVKFKWQTLISVVSLAFGLVCLAFSANWFWYETHYESFRRDADKMYQLKFEWIDSERTDGGSSFPPLMYELMRRTLSPKDDVVLFFGRTRETFHEFNGRELKSCGCIGVSDNYLEVMGQPLLHGDIRTALTRPGQAVISRSLAERVFGTENVVGRQLDFDWLSFTITGVTEDVPAHSHLRADVYTNYESMNPREAWQWHNFSVGVLIKTADTLSVMRRLAAMADTEEMKQLAPMRMFLLPIGQSFDQKSDTTFWTDFLYPVAFTAVSALLMLSALFNYVFILTTQMAGRLREYKLRISLGGSFRKNAVWLLTEVGVVQGLVVVVSAMAVELASYFSGMTDVCATIYRAWGLCLVPYFLLVALGLVYPLWNLRRLYRAQFAGRAVRPQRPGAMLVVQLATCVLLLFVFWGAGRQFRLMLDGDLGFTTANILRVGNEYGALDDVYFDLPDAIRSAGTSSVDDAIAVGSDLFWYNGFMAMTGAGLGLEGEGMRDSFALFMDVYPRVFRFFDVKPESGRLFNEQDDGTVEFLLSPEAQRTLQIYDYDSLSLTFKGLPAKVIGVVDIKRTPFQEAHEPVIYFRWPDREAPPGNVRRSAIYVKYKPGMRAEAEQVVAGVLKKFEVPEDRVEVTSFDEYIRTYYEKELRYFRLFSMLMAGSVLITLFGVVSMSMYTMRMHRRSIAIRRIYGAGFWLLARHYLGGYVGVSLLAAVVAYPVGLYAMTEWLKAYTERVDVGWLQGVAVLAVVLALVVAVVLWQVRRVMNDDPADVVRSE